MLELKLFNKTKFLFSNNNILFIEGELSKGKVFNDENLNGSQI